MIAEELLEIMRCLRCEGTLREDEERQELVCNQCGYRYPIRDGIPVMLEEEAMPPDA